MIEFVLEGQVMAINGPVSVQYWLLKQKNNVVVKAEKDEVEVPHSNDSTS